MKLGEASPFPLQLLSNGFHVGLLCKTILISQPFRPRDVNITNHIPSSLFLLLNVPWHFVHQWWAKLYTHTNKHKWRTPWRVLLRRLGIEVRMGRERKHGRLEQPKSIRTAKTSFPVSWGCLSLARGPTRKALDCKILKKPVTSSDRDSKQELLKCVPGHFWNS